LQQLTQLLSAYSSHDIEDNAWLQLQPGLLLTEPLLRLFS
jgi:hypothetical protein